jgi:hypothetical protein
MQHLVIFLIFQYIFKISHIFIHNSNNMREIIFIFGLCCYCLTKICIFLIHYNTEIILMNFKEFEYMVKLYNSSSSLKRLKATLYKNTIHILIQKKR